MPYTVTLPCKVRCSVYVLDGEDVIGMIVDRFEIYANTGAWAVLVDSIMGKPERKITLNIKAFGKTVFLTRDEADAAMERRATQ